MHRSTLRSLADEDLVRLAVAGDKAAFAEAVRRHEPTARSLTTRLVCDAELAALQLDPDDPTDELPGEQPRA